MKRVLVALGLLPAVVAMQVQAAPRPPVLLVHGIDDTEAIFVDMRRALLASGRRHVEAIDLVPNNGDASLRELAVQVSHKVARMRQETGAEQVDLVAYSMGGMVSRYYLQKLGGHEHVRRFVTLASPHRGTASAYFRWNPGAEDMRFNSDFLRELEANPEVLASVEMTTIWSPFDLMILPAFSSRVAGVRERVIPVLAHPWMVRDARACQAVVEALDEAR